MCQVQDSVLVQTVIICSWIFWEWRNEYANAGTITVTMTMTTTTTGKKNTVECIHTTQLRFLLVLMSIYLSRAYTRYTMSSKHVHFFFHGFWSCCAFRLWTIWSEKKRWCLHLYATSIVFICYLLFRAKKCICVCVFIFLARIFPLDFDISYSFIFIQLKLLLFRLLPRSCFLEHTFYMEALRYNCIKRRQRKAK